MEPAIALQLILAVTQYCSGSGEVTEYLSMLDQKNIMVSDARASKLCFEKIWHCGHNTTHADSIAFDTHNCISKHINGELK